MGCISIVKNDLGREEREEKRVVKVLNEATWMQFARYSLIMYASIPIGTLWHAYSIIMNVFVFAWMR